MQEAIQQYVEREGGPRELQERSLGVVDRISGNWPASDRPGSARVAEQLGDGSGSRESEEHTSELQSRLHLVCRLLLEKKKNKLRRSEMNTATCRRATHVFNQQHIRGNYLHAVSGRTGIPGAQRMLPAS